VPLSRLGSIHGDTVERLEHKMETKKGGLSDRNRNTRLSSWLNSTTKPDWMKGHPVAVAIVSILIDKGAETHDYSVSTHVLAATLCCGPTLVKKELSILQAREWITKTKSNGSASWYALTGKYQSHLETKVEVSEDAKRFSLWFRRELQQKHWALVHKYNQRRADNPKREHAHHLNAARVLEVAGSFERAKEMATCAVVLHTSTAIQSLYNVYGIVNQQSFAAEFEQWLKNPTALTASKPELARVIKEAEQAKLDRLVNAQIQAYDSYNKWERFQPHAPELKGLLQAALDANDAAAHQAMKMGIPPDDFVYKKILAPNRYREVWKMQYEKGEQQ
jgi:hypothetical protein